MASSSSVAAADVSGGGGAACDICMEVYDGQQHVPKFLACGHSYCAVCIERLPKVYNNRRVSE